MMLVIPATFALNNQTDLNSESDYYFDASQDADGNGSQDSPYKFLTNDKLVEDSVIHLSEGEYELNKGKTIYNLTIVGVSCQNTVVKFQNTNSVLTSMGTLNLHNLTLLDVSIINYGTLNATNVTFKNSIAYLKYSQATDIVNSASNSFGGAIYCPSYQDLTANVYIENCTFINNTAEYGGAVYMEGGNLNILNSLFLDNYAYNFGGAVACDYNSRITIEKSKFINSRSVNDAGGALYLKDSKLTANDVSIDNSNATFGAAITSLSSTVTINRLNFSNNQAKYEGGAIYQFYGSLTLRNSNLINNSAKNGGALFIDNTTSSILYQNIFTNNTAFSHGGAVYSLLNSKTRFNYNEYYDNKAKVENDFYETSSINLVIGNGNYTMYNHNISYFDNLPSNYSSLSTSVKDQQSGGNCWAFAGIAVLESCILKASGDNLDLSEENMKNLMESYSDFGWDMETNGGGYPSMIMGYLTSWLGPVLEIEDSNDDYSVLSPVLNSTIHVQNIKYIKRTSYTDNDEIKRAILQYGAVGTGIYFDSSYFNTKNSAYYCSITTLTNHAVTIVGWDDNYSKKNFVNRPKGNGAFLVKNSWNTDWGIDGYFYVSYYDTSLVHLGDNEAAYTFILNDTVRYDKNYQYDIPGKTDYLISYNDNIWYQNVFESGEDEYLAAVSTYFEKTCNWDVYVYVNDSLKATANGIGECGYYTIDLGNYVALKAGDIFKIVFKVTANNSSFPISEKLISNKVLYKPGISFFSYDGKNWTDLYDYAAYTGTHTYLSQVACIKAFTFLDKINSTLTLTTSDKDYNPSEIMANVVNQYGYPVMGGNVSFHVDGKVYTVPVSNGIAKINLTLLELAVSNVSARYDGIGYLSSNSSSLIEISRISTNISFKVNKIMTNANITVILSNSANESVSVILNNQSYIVSTVNGLGVLALENLKMGDYIIKGFILNDTFVSFSNSEIFNINVSNSKFNASDMITYFKSGDLYSIQLIDDNNNCISDANVKFEINAECYENVTDDEGKAYLPLILENGEYNISCKFDGDENYFNSSITKNIIVKSTIILDKKDVYLLNTNYSLSLLDSNGDFLNNTNITVTINNREYVSAVQNGSVLLNIGLNPGKYDVLIVNPMTGENYTDEINVISRITGNKDLTMYFNNGASYKVRIRDDNGDFVGAGKTVKFTIKGKTYSRKTNSAGYAELKIALSAKTYTIKAEYNGFKVSNKIIVKPVLTAKNVSKKKTKKVKFSAKLVNGKGKPLKSKKITFKFKGKTYKIKTNKKGIASLTLSNLKIGKHNIITKYGKSLLKNKIIIKK